MKLLGLPFALLALCSSTNAQSFVDTFENGTNIGGWTYVFGSTTIQGTGGHPGGFLREAPLTQFVRLQSTAPGVFSGDYRNRGVSFLGADLNILAFQFGMPAQVNLSLHRDNGTPLDTTDDCVATVILNVFFDPAGQVGTWIPFDVPVPSDSLTIPDNWSAWCNTPGLHGDQDGIWNAIISKVSRVEFSLFSITALQDIYEVGFDNMRVSQGGGVSSCFGDTTGTACPCGNFSPASARAGCLNSASTGALLLADGQPSVITDALAMRLEAAPPTTLAVLVSGDNLLPIAAPGQGIVTFDGLRCVGGNFRRHGLRMTDPIGDSMTPWTSIASSANFTAGQTRHFQVFYRDTALLGCGNGINTSQAMTIEFTP